MRIKNLLHPMNYLGLRTKRKIVVFESDDWGCGRFNDRATYENVRENQLIKNDPYYRIDALETNQDLISLYEVLANYKDSNGNHPIITANYVTANPDYNKIKVEGFNKYYYEPTISIYERDSRRNKVLSLYKYGIENGLIKPQYHGREHLDVYRWMKALRNENPIARQAFKYKFVYISSDKKDNRRVGITAAFDYEEDQDTTVFKSYLEDMKRLFIQAFGFESLTFIAPAYTWHPNLEKYLYNIGVKGIQGTWKQTCPTPERKDKGYKYIKHYMGQKNKHGQIYLPRNAFFEPVIEPGKDAFSTCLERIQLAFIMRKPAIVGSHRLNFIGSLCEQNRNRNLELFDNLLQSIIKKWPNVEFMSSDQMVKEFNND